MLSLPVVWLSWYASELFFIAQSESCQVYHCVRSMHHSIHVAMRCKSSPWVSCPSSYRTGLSCFCVCSIRSWSILWYAYINYFQALRLHDGSGLEWSHRFIYRIRSLSFYLTSARLFYPISYVVKIPKAGIKTRGIFLELTHIFNCRPSAIRRSISQLWAKFFHYFSSLFFTLQFGSLRAGRQNNLTFRCRTCEVYQWTSFTVREGLWTLIWLSACPKRFDLICTDICTVNWGHNRNAVHVTPEIIADSTCHPLLGSKCTRLFVSRSQQGRSLDSHAL